MSTLQWVGTIFMAAMVVAVGFQMPAYWRGESRDFIDENTRGWWPFGEALRRGGLRSIHLGVAICATGVLAVVSFEIHDRVEARWLEATTFATAWAFSILFLVSLVIDASVLLFNRPRWLVPPRYRDEPGAIRMWHGPPSGSSTTSEK